MLLIFSCGLMDRHAATWVGAPVTSRPLGWLSPECPVLSPHLVGSEWLLPAALSSLRRSEGEQLLTLSTCPFPTTGTWFLFAVIRQGRGTGRAAFVAGTCPLRINRERCFVALLQVCLSDDFWTCIVLRFQYRYFGKTKTTFYLTL